MLLLLWCIYFSNWQICTYKKQIKRQTNKQTNQKNFLIFILIRYNWYDIRNWWWWSLFFYYMTEMTFLLKPKCDPSYNKTNRKFWSNRLVMRWSACIIIIYRLYVVYHYLIFNIKKIMTDSEILFLSTVEWITSLSVLCNRGILFIIMRCVYKSGLFLCNPLFLICDTKIIYFFFKFNKFWVVHFLYVKISEQ